MGTKRRIAELVADSIKTIRPDKPVVDLFCGMCAVAGAVSPSGRRVTGNDVQEYAALAARCLIVHESKPDEELLERLIGESVHNAELLFERFAQDILEERRLLANPSVSGYECLHGSWKHAANDAGVAQEVSEMRLNPRAIPYRLCTLTFSWGYFGLEQSIWIDSVRAAIDLLSDNGDLNDSQADWALLALVQTASVVSSTTGHTAQFIQARTAKSLERVVRQRKRDVIATLREQWAGLHPFGDKTWRSGNRVTTGDSLKIWPQLAQSVGSGVVVYADPPYTKNQYSRFYHVLETLTRYDYPEASGIGRYRPDRFSTPFSTRTGVVSAFSNLCSGVKMLDGVLVLSYPAAGMLSQYSEFDVQDLLRNEFDRVRLVLDEATWHSTMGARYGQSRSAVREQVFVAS